MSKYVLVTNHSNIIISLSSNSVMLQSKNSLARGSLPAPGRLITWLCSMAQHFRWQRTTHHKKTPQGSIGMQQHYRIIPRIYCYFDLSPSILQFLWWPKPLWHKVKHIFEMTGDKTSPDCWTKAPICSCHTDYRCSTVLNGLQEKSCARWCLRQVQSSAGCCNVDKHAAYGHKLHSEPVAPVASYKHISEVWVWTHCRERFQFHMQRLRIWRQEEKENTTKPPTFGPMVPPEEYVRKTVPCENSWGV